MLPIATARQTDTEEEWTVSVHPNVETRTVQRPLTYSETPEALRALAESLAVAGFAVHWNLWLDGFTALRPGSAPINAEVVTR